MGRTGINIWLWWENKEKDHCKNLDIDGRIILKRILDKNIWWYVLD
jgi:hypothetical protein